MNVKSITNMRTTSRMVTPELAAYYLGTMATNRPLSSKRVASLVEIMNNGQWCEETHQGIAFNKDGQLIDGQHRLHALIRSNKSLMITVSENVSNDAFKIIDAGKSRTAGDTLATEGVKNYNSHASGILGYLSFKKGLIYANRIEVKTNSIDILDFYKQNSVLLDEIYTLSNKCYMRRRLMPRKYIYSFFLKLVFLDGKKKEDVINFFYELFDINIVTNTSISLLSDRLIRVGLSKMNMPNIELTALMIKTFNYYQSDTNVKTLRWDSIKEPFPTIL